MFAGAAREAVFSDPAVIKLVKEGFVPVALKAGLVNNPPDSAEGRLYAEIGRSKPAPQGICVVNSSGKVLAWALNFDDEKSVLDFFERTQQLFRDKPRVTERYMRFPSSRLPDIADNGVVAPVPEKGTVLPMPKVPKGTLEARLVGRAVEKDGRLTGQTLQQEKYVEDRFDIRPELLAGLKPGPVPANLARHLVQHAYLGMLDVAPKRIEKAEFTATKLEGGDLRIEGTSRALGGGGARNGVRNGVRTDGAVHDHEVTLTWRGFIRMRDGKIVRLVLLAEGHEKLSWGNPRMIRGKKAVAHLPAGRAFEIDTKVRYGIVATPAPAARILAPGEKEARPGGQPPASLLQKMTRLQAAVRKWRDAGKDLAPVGRAMEGFEPHIKAGRFGEAEKVLDGALTIIEKK